MFANIVFHGSFLSGPSHQNICFILIYVKSHVQTLLLHGKCIKPGTNISKFEAGIKILESNCWQKYIQISWWIMNEQYEALVLPF